MGSNSNLSTLVILPKPEKFLARANQRCSSLFTPKMCLRYAVDWRLICCWALWFAPSRKGTLSAGKHQTNIKADKLFSVDSHFWGDPDATVEVRRNSESISFFFLKKMFFCDTQVNEDDNILNIDPEQRLQQLEKILLIFFFSFFFPQEQHDLCNFNKGGSFQARLFYQITTKIMKFLLHRDKQKLYLNARLKLPSWKEKSKPHAGSTFIIMRGTCA